MSSEESPGPALQKRFAETVVAAFAAAGRFTDQEIANAGGPSTTTMTALRKVAQGKATMAPPRGDTLRKIDTAAKWPLGSARALWLGGPAPQPNADEQYEGPSMADVVEGRPASQGQVRALLERVDTLEAYLQHLLEVAKEHGWETSVPGDGRPDIVANGLVVELKNRKVDEPKFDRDDPVDVFVYYLAHSRGPTAALRRLKEEGPEGAGVAEVVWERAVESLEDIAARMVPVGGNVDRARREQDQVEQGSQDRGSDEPA